MGRKGPLPHSQVSAPVPLVSQLAAVRTSTSHFQKIHLNIILPSGIFLSGFSIKTLYMPPLSPIHTTCLAHLILLDFITQTILDEEYRSLSFSLCSFLCSPVTLSLLGQNILLNTLFWNTLFLDENRKWKLLTFIRAVYLFSSFMHRYKYCSQNSNDTGLRNCTGSYTDWYWGQMMTFCGESIIGVAG